MAPALFAQTTGQIQGTINGADGRPLPGVTLEASSPSLQGIRVTVTGNDGTYRFISLPPGTYKIRASLSGFTTVEKTATVQLDSAATVYVQLRVAAREEVIVTAEAPVVDSTSAESGTVVRQEIAQKLAIGRNYSSVVAIQPGVNQDLSETQGRALAMTIYGATSVENSYLVDGVNTTNIIKGFQGKALTQEFIEEVQVKASGYAAEYGRAMGGVINVVTRSGGNQFHGDAFGYFDEKALTASYQGHSAVVLSADGSFTNSGTDIEYAIDGTPISRQDYGADLGGYLMKDHIWFFGAYNRVTFNQSQTLLAGSAALYPTAGEDLPFDSTSNIYSGKLTFRLGAGTTIVGTVFGDPENRTGNLANLTATNPLIRHANRALGGLDYAASVTQLFGSSALVTARSARHVDSYLLSPVAGGDSYQIRDNTSGAAALVSHGFGSIFGTTGNNHSTRDAYTLMSTLYMGDHEVKAGGDYESNATLTTSYYTGGSALSIYSCPTDTTNPNVRPCTANAPIYNGNPVYYGHSFYTSTTDRTQVVDGYLPGGSVANPKGLRASAFAQDKWTVIPALTVSLGIRWDQEEVQDYTHTAIFTLKNEWQPRIGVAWDVVGDGSSKLAASAGRFYFALPTDLQVRAYGAQTTATTFNYSSDSDDLTADPNAPKSTSVQGGPFTEPVQGYTTNCGQPGFPSCQATLEGIYQDEYTLGFDKAVDPTFAVGVKGTYRHLGRTIEDRCDVDPGYPEANGSTCVLINPGSSDRFATGNFHGCSGPDYLDYSNNPRESYCGSPATFPSAAVPAARREYWAGEIVAKKQIGSTFWAQASYIYSSLLGNYDGAAQQSNGGQTDPGINADFDYAAFVTNASGRLYLDRPNSFRLDAAYTFPFSLTLGLSAFVHSGAPRNKLGYFNNNYGSALYLVPRGSYGTLPADYAINASLLYTIKLTPVDITVFLQGFNLINRQTALDVDPEYTVDAPGTPDEFYGSFGKINTRRAPRSLRFGGRVSF